MKIVIAGSGNVATQLGRALLGAGFPVAQVWSPTYANAAELAARLGAAAVAEAGGLDRDADLYVLAVKDDAIPAVAAGLAGVPGMVVHTSGTTPMHVLSKLPAHGVFYPLQTFSRFREIDFSDVPLCLEAGSTAVLEGLRTLAGRLSSRVYEVSSAQRRSLHVAAVFANNFSNHLFSIAAGVLNDSNLPFDLLRPLIRETAAKVQDGMPAEMQTGPAIRGDQQTIDRHLGMLQYKPEWARLYLDLSESIKKTGK
ncbi:DUF2520 domain-containing protein [Pedobacter yulinensis]|uniref:DUF2520 domain-containing protein n=1 Tax=Pedobacter yulinensis TaxID=2126353 RepID=A0A2T3HH41_9SPHI|nr:Rossmann-like and DUF2520 domain-containing protein [Pedobacter yulinensis]PST81765.1 DUF2520 domain-containing protein [Pedobacter yulinensis]